MTIWQDFLLNERKVIHKWTHYFPIYERHFSPWVNKAVTFMEIGVSQGGSLSMWQRYLGPHATIIGIDIDPSCAKHETPGIHVRIGDQSDTVFLDQVIDEFGVPDIVLDDGSHQMNDMITTFQHVYPKMLKNTVYMVEDLHTAYWDEYCSENPLDNFLALSKAYVDVLNIEESRGKVRPDPILAGTFGISFYPSAVVYERVPHKMFSVATGYGGP